jgi:hypothetical protein
VPGYPAGRDKLHIGNHVRRDLILPKGPWPWGDDRRVELANGLVVHGVHVPSEPGVGRKVYLELGVSHPQPKDKPESNFRILAFASDGTTTVSWELPPGYDWVEPRKWKADERFHGRYDLKLPDAMHAGTWDLGLVVLDAAGAVVPPAVVGPGAVIGGEGVDAAPARLARGEFVYPGALVVLEDDALKEAANQDVHAAVAQAEEGDCDAAEQSWFLGRMHRPDDAEWVKNRRERVETAIGRCWAVTSDGLDRQDRIARLVRARRWDRTGEELLDRAVPLAAELHAEGLSARESQDWQSAYRLFSDAVALDVTRSWSRRYAEEARAFRLGIDPESLARKAAAEAQKKAEAEARRVERQKATKAKAKAKAPVSPEAPKP